MALGLRLRITVVTTTLEDKAMTRKASLNAVASQMKLSIDSSQRHCVVTTDVIRHLRSRYAIGWQALEMQICQEIF